MKLAVIVPNYNNGKYIKKCIESILAQSLVPDEIIIVDDNSKDLSPSIIKEYENKYSFIKGIYLSKNKGVSNARNIGFLSADSEYITTIDSDDFYYNDKKLENEMNLIKKYKEKYNRDIIAYSKVIRADSNGKLIADNRKYYYFEKNITVKLLSEFKVRCVPRDYCFKKEIYLKSGGYNLNMNLYEDLDLLVRLSNISEFYCTKEYGTAYRMTPGGLSRKSSEEHDKAKKHIYLKYINTLTKYNKLKCIVFKQLLNVRRRIKGV